MLTVAAAAAKSPQSCPTLFSPYVVFFPCLEAPGSSLPIYKPGDLESEHSCQGSGVRNVRSFLMTIKKSLSSGFIDT